MQDGLVCLYGKASQQNVTYCMASGDLQLDSIRKNPKGRRALVGGEGLRTRGIAFHEMPNIATEQKLDRVNFLVNMMHILLLMEINQDDS